MVTPLRAVGEPGDRDGALLRAALEVAARLAVEGHVPVPVGELTGGRLHEDAVVPVLDRVRARSRSSGSRCSGSSGAAAPAPHPEGGAARTVPSRARPRRPTTGPCADRRQELAP